jgi:hypothetical protein
LNREVLPEQEERLLLALYTQDRWVTRTVDRVSFIERNTISRRITRHFTLPNDDAARPILDGRLILPVFSLRKGSFISCDLRDASDHRVALRPIEERWELTFNALMALFRLADPEAPKDTNLCQLLRALIVRQEAQPIRSNLLEYGQALQNRSPEISNLIASRSFGELSKFICFNYIVYVDLDPASGDSQMISYVIDQRFPDRRQDFEEAKMSVVPRRRLLKQLGLMPHRYYHPITISGAGSTHLEIKAPDGVDIGERKLQLPGRRLPISAPGTSERRARFLAPRTVEAGEGYARLDIVPGSGVMRRAGPYILFLLAGLIGFLALVEVPPSSGAALLLIIPSLASLVAARPNEHPYVTSVVILVRMLVLAPIPLAALATAILLSGWPHEALVPVIGLAVAIGLILVVGQYRLRGRDVYREVVHNDLTRVA